jgi:diguanylate cyclase (GGDEF)-like protein
LSIDARTLLVVGGLLSWTLAAAIEFQSVRPNRDQILPDPWTLGLLAKGLGLNLLSQRGLIPDAWSISLANALLLMGPLFCYSALQRVRGVATNYLLIAAVPVGVGVLLAVIGFAPEQFPARALAFTAAGLFGFSLNCWAASQVWRAGFKAGATMIIGSSAVLALIGIAHAFAVMSGGISGLFGGNKIQIALYTVNALCIALGTFGYMDILRTLRDRESRIDPDLLPDPLTGLYSRRSFVVGAQAEMARARLRGNPISIMKIHVDGLDRLAASHGRAFADQQLKRVAAKIQSEIRNFDLAGRLAPNRIGVMMPEFALAEAHAAAERIRVAVEAEELLHNGTSLRITVSTGLCSTDPEHADLESIMALADACLHRANLAGGNQIATPASLPSKAFVEGTV